MIIEFTSNVKQPCKPSSHNAGMGTLELVFNEMEMSETLLTDMERERLGDDPQAVILCEIIQNQPSLNKLQLVVIEEALKHAIVNKGRQCRHRDEQFLLYVRGKGGVGKSRVVKASPNLPCLIPTRELWMSRLRARRTSRILLTRVSTTTTGTTNVRGSRG